MHSKGLVSRSGDKSSDIKRVDSDENDLDFEPLSHSGSFKTLESDKSNKDQRNISK